MKEIYTRTLVAIVAVPLFIFMIWMGKIYFALTMAIIALLGLFELYRIAEVLDIRPQKSVGYLSTIVLAYFFLHTLDEYISFVIILATILVLFLEMLRLKERPLADTAVTILGIIYVGLFLSVLIGIRENGMAWNYNMRGLFVIILFVAVWMCDSMAYFFGSRFGRHKLFPKVSPKKSVEGAIAGFFGSLVFLVIIYFFQILPGFDVIDVFILAFLTGIFGQVGDLLESWLKRSANIKDSSSLLPGHGGVLDRFDSMLIVAPLTYMLIQINFI